MEGRDGFLQGVLGFFGGGGGMGKRDSVSEPEYRNSRHQDENHDEDHPK